MSDFHQEMTFKLYFTSTSSLCFWVQIVCLFVCLFFFWCLDHSRINEHIFILKKFVGRTWPKEEVTKRKIWILFWIQKIKNFQRSHFNVFLMNLAFYLIFLRKLIYMFGFILSSSLQYFISLWSHGVEHFALSECILLIIVNHTKWGLQNYPVNAWGYGCRVGKSKFLAPPPPPPPPQPKIASLRPCQIRTVQT